MTGGYDTKIDGQNIYTQKGNGTVFFLRREIRCYAIRSPKGKIPSVEGPSVPSFQYFAAAT